MPPRHPRLLYKEATLGRRMTYERQARGWTRQNLADRMTAAGCKIDQSSIAKIENGTATGPPRRITVEEMCAFSVVFGLSLDELLLPPEVVAEQAVLHDWRQYVGHIAVLIEQHRQADAAWFALSHHLQTYRAAEQALAKVLGLDPDIPRSDDDWRAIARQHARDQHAAMFPTSQEDPFAMDEADQERVGG